MQGKKSFTKEKSKAVTTDFVFGDHLSRAYEPYLSSRPERIKCPYCRKYVRTTIEIEPSFKTHCIAVVLIILCLPCSCLPYCIYACHNHNHYCPDCGGFIGTHKF